MCLIVFAFQPEASTPLIVAGNRDEFHARPAQTADWWPDDRNILGGRDLQAGGTWLAVGRNGRFAAVTNYRDASATNRGKRSRGHLVTDFLRGSTTPAEFVADIDTDVYAGFNVIVADESSLAYRSNRSNRYGALPPGVYGLSNATLDTPWEKVARSKNRLQHLISTGDANETSLLRLLGDREKGPLDEVEPDRLPFATAHAITAPFIVLPEYGTRCSTVLIAARDKPWRFIERRFAADGERSGESQYSFVPEN